MFTNYSRLWLMLIFVLSIAGCRSIGRGPDNWGWALSFANMPNEPGVTVRLLSDDLAMVSTWRLNQRNIKTVKVKVNQERKQKIETLFADAYREIEESAKLGLHKDEPAGMLISFKDQSGVHGMSLHVRTLVEGKFPYLRLLAAELNTLFVGEFELP